ncbi:hypothetical protein Sjap_012002 [Stephania japonica]|uniref:RBR-type E3 ubiquitin transferase n=1 Tax=Stephania japonica TaxID=461633 RepID=A0AAP0P7X0_9MAGN
MESISLLSVLANETKNGESSSNPSRFSEICEVTTSQKGCFSVYFCSDCNERYLIPDATEKDDLGLIPCSEPNCDGFIEPRVVYCDDESGGDESRALIDGLLRFDCPFEDCDGVLVDDGGVAVKESECPYCHRLFCAQCKVAWHSGIDCEEFRVVANANESKRGEMKMVEGSGVMGSDHKCSFEVENSEISVHMLCRECNKNDTVLVKPSSTEDRALLELIAASALRNKNIVNIPQELEEDTAMKRVMPSTSTLINVPLSLVPVTIIGESSSSKDSSFVCEICDEPKLQKESFNIKGCSHYFCSECMVKYVASKIQENITLIRCPEPGCQGELEPQFCHSILPLEVFDRWVDALCEAFILGTQRYYCPYKDCSAPLVYDEGMVIEESECPHCHRLFCAQCKVPWHPGIGCADYQKLNENERVREDLMVMELAKERKWQRCPMCKFYVERIDGCLYMKCSSSAPPDATITDHHISSTTTTPPYLRLDVAAAPQALNLPPPLSSLSQTLSLSLGLYPSSSLWDRLCVVNGGFGVK